MFGAMSKFNPKVTDMCAWCGLLLLVMMPIHGAYSLLDDVIKDAESLMGWCLTLGVISLAISRELHKDHKELEILEYNGNDNINTNRSFWKYQIFLLLGIGQLIYCTIWFLNR